MVWQKSNLGHEQGQRLIEIQTMECQFALGEFISQATELSRSTAIARKLFRQQLADLLVVINHQYVCLCRHQSLQGNRDQFTQANIPAREPWHHVMR